MPQRGAFRYRPGGQPRGTIELCSLSWIGDRRRLVAATGRPALSAGTASPAARLWCARVVSRSGWRLSRLHSATKRGLGREVQPYGVLAPSRDELRGAARRGVVPGLLQQGRPGPKPGRKAGASSEICSSKRRHRRRAPRLKGPRRKRWRRSRPRPIQSPAARGAAVGGRQARLLRPVCLDGRISQLDGRAGVGDATFVDGGTGS